MSIVRASRRQLDAALKNADLAVLVLAGSASSDAQRIHDRAEETITEPFRKTFLITSLGVLSAAEKRDWFDGQVERYAVIGGDGRVIAARGTCADLMLTTRNEPSVMAIRSAFAKGGLA